MKKKGKNRGGSVYMKSTKRNIFCTLIDKKRKKVETSCTLRVPPYLNEFNERENLFKRGFLLGELFGSRIADLGYTEVAIFLDFGTNKGRMGVIRGIGKSKIKISFIQIFKTYPHNGCRPQKMRHKKIRTKQKY